MFVHALLPVDNNNLSGTIPTELDHLIELTLPPSFQFGSAFICKSKFVDTNAGVLSG